MVDDSGNSYCFGANFNGQLGLGNELITENPVLLEDLKGKVKEMKTNEDMNFILTNNNEIYFWGFTKGYNVMRPIKLFLDKKIVVNSISCGKNFCIILSKQGILYSFGNTNKFGELGSGNFDIRESPEPIYSLMEAGEKIVQVECGYKHVVARDGIGKVFTWGNVIYFFNAKNSNGQCGFDRISSINVPTLVNFDSVFKYRKKIIQIAAGIRQSFFLSDSREIIYSGFYNNVQSSTPKKIEIKNIVFYKIFKLSILNYLMI